MVKTSIKSVIFYFSQVVTGNTKKIAENIAKGLQYDNNECDLIALRKYNDDIELIKGFKFQVYDLIGLGVPVYYFHPPYHILFELEHFPDLRGKQGFLFCTSGGNPGSTLYQLKKALEHTKLKIIDGCDKWLGCDVHQMYATQKNSNGHYGWLPTSYGHPNKDELNEAFKFGLNLLSLSEDIDISEKVEFWSKDNPSAKMWSWKGIQAWFPEFDLIKDKCTQCGLCAELCPWDAIILDPYPRWIKDCDRCYICDLKCPEQAIQCNFTDQIKYLTGLMKAKK